MLDKTHFHKHASIDSNIMFFEMMTNCDMNLYHSARFDVTAFLVIYYEFNLINFHFVSFRFDWHAIIIFISSNENFEQLLSATRKHCAVT